MASARQLKALRVHHEALTRHEQILKGHAGRGSTLLGEDEADPILEELGRLEQDFADLVPPFLGAHTGDSGSRTEVLQHVGAAGPCRKRPRKADD
jgi:hypothetical protein